ncbi:muscle M-line assembly protein unc-89 [Xiphias gladius]|uniref:muscle M-line assembly protein unc-89 n=1 Tax=Xiphias gladius TaxID=8245 RepID=UPI001A97DA59|nr:muscle M-line assembly protein unc-89 [Xiphias gladius]
MWSVFFVFLAYLDGNFVQGDSPGLAPDAEREREETFSALNCTFCAKVSTAGGNSLYQVSGGAAAVRSVVGPSGKLVNCSVTADQRQVRSFMHECRSGPKGQRAGRQPETRSARMNEAKVTCREFKERSGRGGRLERDDSADTALRNKALKRSKRGLTYPGTLWCGAGNMADHYDQLGDFAETDSCCRTHDHCPHVIHAFSSKYGHTNFKWHSICHCDCDKALKDCLRKVNDTSSRVVGQAFFNVIGVPCFEFEYEEQCAERHWYGLCKRYEKLPIAVLKEAVPYDFGGIDVIDELTVAPPKRKDSKKSEEEERLESATQSTMTGPEEPSLTNVVTAAEDFIKVLATVSTSQSSTTDSDKGETQSSEKKKRKDTGKKKKTTKKQKGEGKGRKRKQKAGAGVKSEEGAAVSPSGSKALSNFISESRKHDQSSRNTNRVGDNEYELEGKEEPSNEVMKDEPPVDKESVSITSSMIVQEKPAESDTDAQREEITLSASTSTTFTPHEAKSRGLRKGRRKKSKKAPLPSAEELVTNTTDNLSAISVPTIITPVAQQQSFGSDTEKRPVASTASTPIVFPVKRHRSKETGDREGRKKRRKVGSVSPTAAAAHEHSSVDNMKAMPLSGAPTVTPVPTTERQVSHRLDVYGGKTSIYVKAPDSSFSVLKRQGSKERRLRRRKTTLPLSSENPLYHNISENVLPTLQTPDASRTLNSPGTTDAISWPGEKLETHSKWRIFTTAAPTISTKRHRQTIRQQRKPRKKAVPAALGDSVSISEQTEHTPMTFTTTPSKVVAAEELSPQRSEKPGRTTSSTPVMSPVQLSIERAKAQFMRKKRRKAALSSRRQ